MDLTPIRLHLFDLDDTLIVTRPAYLAAQDYALQTVFGVEGLEPRRNRLRYISKTYGSSQVELYLDAFLWEEAASPAEKQRWKEQWLAAYHERYWLGLTAQPGVAAYLQRLQGQGKFLGIVSNGGRATQDKKILATGLADFFPPEVRWVSGDFAPEHKKPSPYMIQQALTHFGLLPEQACYYGNIAEDMLAARLAGITALRLGAEEDHLPQVAKADQVFLEWAHWGGEAC